MIHAILISTGLIIGSVIARNPHMTKISIALWVLFAVLAVFYG